MDEHVQPDVTVVVPVFDAMPYLVTCLASLMEQSIGRDRVEVVVVDDGSTDGSGALLDLLAAAWPGLRVVHQEASGGPSRPRNTGLDLAGGRYVYFLDADDYLGTEALARMVALADERRCDVVACRRTHIGGRKGEVSGADHVPLAARPRHEGMDAEEYLRAARRGGSIRRQTPLLVALSNCKQLYRRERIDERGLRFPEGIHIGEDAVFSADYLDGGATVAMVDDYDCYYERVRDDGGNITTRLIGTLAHVESLDRGLALLERYPDLRWRCDLFVRDAALDLLQQVFGPRFVRRDVAERRALVARGRELLDARLSPRVAARLPALDRVKTCLVRRGLEPELHDLVATLVSCPPGRVLISEGRVYADLPYRDDPALGLPADCYDVTDELPVRHHLSRAAWDGTRLRLAGHGYIECVDTVDVATQLVLRERLGRCELRQPVRPVPAPEPAGGPGLYRYGLAGFETEVDGSSLVPGSWTVLLAVTAQGVTREVPLGGNRDAALDPAQGGPGGRIVATFSRYGTLTLEVPA